MNKRKDFSWFPGNLPHTEDSMGAKSILRTADDYILCNECGTQYPLTEDAGKDECKDPRQYVPATGQAFTTLAKLRAKGHKNVWYHYSKNRNVWWVRTEPQFAIGERAELIITPSGNVLWDLIPFLDQETVDKINWIGGLKAIVISHPHYYSTWADWSRTFECPVFVGAPDESWIECRDTPGADIRLLSDVYTPILPGVIPGVTAILVGGHFPGSLLLHWDGILFNADTFFTVPSGTNPVPGKPGVQSFSFFWSIPNRIPMHPDDILGIWHKVKSLHFHTCMGAFKGQDVRTLDNERERGTGGVKGRLLESCKIFVKATGWKEDQHAIFAETL
ncbi:hypothetical protein LTR37_005569 [Vermiconidia calcicola]|uniref:Uncharacterized protein n=1 Tax=Vermiconidia calcicola TaxID=1690605 RepID=A0ACC3NIT2_9PEZI|nr:hypothetical protein LTR37_005569 [Vermiconidia calcicola]